MRVRTLVGGAIVAVSVVAGCTDTPAPTESALTGAPQLDFMNNPKDGPVVYRWYNEGFWTVTTDPSRNRAAFHPLDVTNDMWCVEGGTSEGIDTVAVQWIENPSHVIRQRSAEDQYVAIYASADLWEIVGPGWSDYCAGITGPLLIATGQVRFHDIVNSDRQGMLQWEGFVDLVAGGRAHYVERQHWVYDEKTDSQRWVLEEIKLTAIKD
ncbi:MAG: hypothetical protein OEY20_13110 [Gemmatimonadota bacterium]|nr:hypothetical protein [Gemmatimonadota bacterium]